MSFLLAPAKKISILIVLNENVGKYIAFDSFRAREDLGNVKKNSVKAIQCSFILRG